MLSGLLVLDLSTLLAGPFCTMLLGEMGAEVIKIEHPQVGDMSRHMGPPFQLSESTMYLCGNRNKKGLALDVSHPRGREILLRLVKEADVFVHNFRPDFVHKLGITYEEISAITPNIIYLTVSGFTEEGPYRMKPGTDTIFQGISGIMMVSGNEDDPPIRLGVPPGDMTAPIWELAAVLGALYHRARTGEGQKIEVSNLEAMMNLQNPRFQEYFATGLNPKRTGAASPFSTPVEYFPTRNGYINISVFTNKFWHRLCKALGCEDLEKDPRFIDNTARWNNHSELTHLLTDIFKTKDTQEWIDVLEKEDIACGPINTYDQVFQDPQVKFAEMKQAMAHPTIGTWHFLKTPLRFSKTPARPRCHPPLKGEHTVEILSKYFEISEIEALRAEGVIWQYTSAEDTSKPPT